MNNKFKPNSAVEDSGKCLTFSISFFFARNVFSLNVQKIPPYTNTSISIQNICIYVPTRTNAYNVC